MVVVTNISGLCNIDQIENTCDGDALDNHVNEARVTFPATFSCPDVKIQFGSFVDPDEEFGSFVDPDEEFRKDYTQNTMDRPLSVFPNDMSQKTASNSVNVPDEIISVSQVLPEETPKTVSSFEEKLADDQNKEEVVGENKQMMNTEEPAKPTEMNGDKECQKTDESMNVDEAMERKKQTDEKAQTPAEMNAQKEAKRKEKARLKRLRKKEKKQAAWAARNAASSNRSVNDGDVTESNESKEIENRNEKPQQPPLPCFVTKQLKPKTIMSPEAVAVAIRNSRRWRLLGDVMIVVVFILSVLSLR